MFDSSLAMIEAAMQGAGVALAPPTMFGLQIDGGTIVRPFATEISTGSYWLTRLKSRAVSPAMIAFENWLTAETGAQATR